MVKEEDVLTFCNEVKKFYSPGEQISTPIIQRFFKLNYNISNAIFVRLVNEGFIIDGGRGISKVSTKIQDVKGAIKCVDSFEEGLNKLEDVMNTLSEKTEPFFEFMQSHEEATGSIPNELEKAEEKLEKLLVAIEMFKTYKP